MKATRWYSVEHRTPADYRDGPAGPFEAILVTAGAPAVVDALTDQLAPAGRLIAPVGGATSQVLLQIDRTADGRLEQRELAPVVFVPLRSGLVD